jgi:hypothetical protein
MIFNVRRNLWLDVCMRENYFPILRNRELGLSVIQIPFKKIQQGGLTRVTSVCLCPDNTHPLIDEGRY